MVDINDPEVIDSLKYLVTPMAEKIKFQSMPFDAKKQCWVAEHKEGFVAGEIQSESGDQATVKTAAGTVRNNHNQSAKTKLVLLQLISLLFRLLQSRRMTVYK